MATELTIDQPVTPSTTPPPGTGYYRIRTSDNDDYWRDKGVVAGALVYVYAGNDAYHCFIDDATWVFAYNNPAEMDEF